MESLDLAGLPEHPLLLLDSAPIIYVLEDHPKFASRFQPLFDAHAAGAMRFAVTTITIAEVLSGPARLGNEVLVRRYRGLFESWHVIPLIAEIAESAALIRATTHLKLPDAIQVASALAVQADALVTHDRDFSSVRSLRVIS
jgi:predicted nucleic acid-binding protein